MELAAATLSYSNLISVIGAILAAIATILIWTVLNLTAKIKHAPKIRPSSSIGSKMQNKESKSITYRLRGIPHYRKVPGVESLVRRALELENDVQVQVQSLASSPYMQNGKIATLRLSRVPVCLSSAISRGEWLFDVPDDEQQDHPVISLVFDTHFRGFTPLHSEDDADCKIDLIAISGLGGHAFGSFKEKNGSHMWLRDSLPKELPGTRIFIYGYDTRLEQSDSFQNIDDLGIQLRTSIGDIRPNANGLKHPKPLLLVGHSLGGIVIKQAMIEMQNGSDFDKAQLRSVYGVLFFGVPSQGMSIESLVPMVGEQPNRFFLESLRQTSSVLRAQSSSFEKAFPYEDSWIIFFYETKESPTARRAAGGSWEMSGQPTVLVAQESAIHGQASQGGCRSIQPVNRNHSELVKFSKYDIDYDTVRGYLLKFREEAYCVIAKRFHDSNPGMMLELSEEQKACLQSLAFEREAWRQNVIATVKGTCNWLLEHPKYANWLNEPQGLLWIKGKPGAGKSTLMKFAVREIEQRKNMDGRVVASFFFNSRGDDLEKTPLGLFRSLLNQILPYFPDQLERLSSEFRKNCEIKGPLGEKWNWTLGYLQDFLASILPEVSGTRPILIYIDALDEIGAKVANDLVRYFRTLIFTIENKRASLRICFSCRHFPIISLEQRLQICVEDENQSDIRAYLEEEVTVQGFKPEEARLVVKEITQRAEGVFQWVDLVLGEVLTLYLNGNPSEVIQKIRDIPKGLDNLYGNLLQGIEQDDRRQSMKLLQWICFALRPLSLRELQQAMAIDVDATYGWLGAKQNSDNYAGTEEDMGRRIQYLSRGLAEIRDAGQGRIAQFIHQSVRDHLTQGGFELLLLGDKSVSRMFKFDSVLAEGMIARSCLKYLCYARALPASKTGNQSGRECARDLANFFDQNALLEYSCLSWTFHLAQSCNQNRGIAKDLEDILTDFIGSSFRTVAWLQAIHYALHNRSSITRRALELSIKGNLAYLNPSRNSYEEWLSRIFGQSGLRANFRYSYFLIDVPGGRFPPMHIAAFFDYADVVKSELDRGVGVDSLAACKQSALACAAKGHSPNACKVLCEAGAKVNATDHIGQIALHIAITTWIKRIHQGHIDTFSVLLEAGSSLATQDRDGRTTMHFLCDVPEENHHVDALNVLLKHGRPEYAMIYDKSLETPLHVAARMGSLRLLKTLLKYIGVPDAFDLSTTTFTLTTTLMHSACSVPNNDDMVEWLIEAGVDVNHQDTRYHRTPLHVTVANGGTYVRRLLVTRPKLELTDRDGCTPLHLAAMAQSSESARLLLEAGSNPFAINMSGQTVLGLIPLEGTNSSEVLFPVLEHIANYNLLFDESLSNHLEALIRSESRSFADAQLIALEINDTARFDIKPNDVLRVLLMLKELLRKQDPGHIAAAILDMAQYWVNSSCLCAVPDHFDEETSERAYLVSEPILGRPQQPVEQVVFTIDSHDQGWSDFPHLHGTYQESHTWFEAQVVVADQPDVVVERRYIMTNVHASPRVRRHVVVWSANMSGSSQSDDLRAIEMWVRSLKPGDRIAVVPRARYLGWVNFVKLVKINIMTSFLKRSSPRLRTDKNV